MVYICVNLLSSLVHDALEPQTKLDIFTSLLLPTGKHHLLCTLIFNINHLVCRPIL